MYSKKFTKRRSDKQDKLKKIIRTITPPDSSLFRETQDRLDNLTKPQGSLGRLEEVAKRLVSITGRKNPELKNKVIFTLAADHGVSEEGISAFPREVTAQMVYNFLNGGAAINVLANHIGARVIVADMGVAEDLKPHPNLKINKINYGTKNMAKGPAMTEEEAVGAITTGIELFEEEFKKGVDIAGVGEMGIGNTTSASAVTAVLTNTNTRETTGRGTGIDGATLEKKILMINRALEVNAPDPLDPLGVLSKIGGFEIGGLAGIILAAASKKVPVVIDGFISSAAALIAYHFTPQAKAYIIASHYSQEKGHRIILNHMGLEPLLDLNLRLGEGTGAALAINIIEAGVKILTQMATFKKASVSQKLGQ